MTIERSAAVLRSAKIMNDRELVRGGGVEVRNSLDWTQLVRLGRRDRECREDNLRNAAARQAGLSLSGKWLLMLADEPLSSASRSLLPTQNGA